LDLSLELPRLPVSSPLPLYYGDIRVTGTVSGASVYLLAHPEDPNSKALAGAIEAESWVHISCFGDVRVVADLKRARILQAERIIDEQRSTQLFMYNALMPGIGGDFSRPIERVPFLRPYLEECENGDYIQSWAATVFFGLRFERIQRIADRLLRRSGDIHCHRQPPVPGAYLRLQLGQAIDAALGDKAACSRDTALDSRLKVTRKTLEFLLVSSHCQSSDSMYNRVLPAQARRSPRSHRFPCPEYPTSAAV
jgi:hypothetical protein